MNKQSSPPALYTRIREILESARTGVARTVNTTQVVSNWLIGREIVEEEQRGNQRADYGKRLVADLSERLTRDFGSGYSSQNLSYMKQFYGTYPFLVPRDIFHALRGKSDTPRRISDLSGILHAPRGEFQSSGTALVPAAWAPGRLNPNLSWTHYRTLLRVEDTVLKCYVLIDIKVGKLTHGDLGQMQLYVNYFDQERRTEGDNPTLGLILCTDKNDAVVKYLLGPDQSKKIATSRYKLHLPTEAELVTELKREAQALR